MLQHTCSNFKISFSEWWKNPETVLFFYQMLPLDHIQSQSKPLKSCKNWPPLWKYFRENKKKEAFFIVLNHHGKIILTQLAELFRTDFYSTIPRWAAELVPRLAAATRVALGSTQLSWGKPEPSKFSPLWLSTCCVFTDFLFFSCQWLLLKIGSNTVDLKQKI